MSQEPTVSVETFAASLPDKYLTCRELGHVWKPYRASYDKSARAYDRELRCTRCRMSKVQLVSESGHVLANSYRQPEGYLAKNVEGAGGARDVFRLESLTRYLNKPHRESA